jgi:TonB family protein
MVAKTVEPVYPDAARSKHVSGAVRMQVHVSKHGDVEDVKVVSGEPLLGPAAINAVKPWKFKPFPLNGEVVAFPTWTTVTCPPADRVRIASDSPLVCPVARRRHQAPTLVSCTMKTWMWFAVLRSSLR